jgi:hypothetical protein
MDIVQNTIKQQEEPPIKTEESQEPKQVKKSWLKSVLEGSFLTRERVIRQLPFLVMLTLMGVIYIFNSNYADKMVIQISKSKRELEELRFNYINTKSTLMQSSRQSELVHRLESRGIKESRVPPRKIILESNNK